MNKKIRYSSRITMTDPYRLNFSYLIPGVLAGMALPGRNSDLNDDLEAISVAGISALVSLTEEPIDPGLLAEYDFDALHLPIEDFTAPSLEQIQTCMAFIDKMRAQGRATAVHCYAGVGRTGTILACYLVKEGHSAREAIKRVRSLRPDSVQTESQGEQVFAYELSLKNDRNSPDDR